MLPAIIGALSKVASTVVDAITTHVKNKDEQKKLLLQFQNEYAQALAKIQEELVKSQSKIIVSEATGHSWLQRNWRPITMLVFVFIIANNFVLVPYAQALFGAHLPILNLPDNVWELIKYGLTGYIGARSVEKGIALGAQAYMTKQMLNAAKEKAQDVVEDELHKVPKVKDIDLTLSKEE